MLPVLLVVGCTDVLPVEVATDSRPEAGRESAVFPLDAFDADERERQILRQAENALAAECMAALGFPYLPAPREFSLEYTTRTNRHYGLTDAEDAARYGYHEADTATAAPAGETPEMSEAELEALYGSQPPDGEPNSPGTAGCSVDAAHDLYGDTQRLDTMARQFSRNVSGDSFLDPRVMTVLSEWSACMQSEGYDVVVPQDPVDKVRKSPEFAPEPTAEEIEMAKKDVACKAETDLIDTWTAVEIELQNAVIAGQYNNFILKDERARIDAMLMRAEALRR